MACPAQFSRARQPGQPAELPSKTRHFPSSNKILHLPAQETTYQSPTSCIPPRRRLLCTPAPHFEIYPQITAPLCDCVVSVSRRSRSSLLCDVLNMAGPHNILPPIGSVTSAPNMSNNAMSASYPATGLQDSNADIMGRPQLPQAPQPTQDPPRRPPPPPLDTMRAYRACLNCRNRKSKCDLDINGGRPVSLASCLFVHLDI